MRPPQSQPLLLDTQLLLWWAIESSLGRADFQVEVDALRLGLLGQGFREFPVRAEQALAIHHLPQP